MQRLDLVAENNSDFYFAIDLSAWAELYDLSTATFRQVLRRYPQDSAAALEFSSGNGRVAFLPGPPPVLETIAPAAALAPLIGAYAYDMRLEIGADVRVALYGGTITFGEGITQ